MIILVCKFCADCPWIFLVSDVFSVLVFESDELSFTKEGKASWEWSFGFGIFFCLTIHIYSINQISVGMQRYFEERFYFSYNLKCLYCRSLQRNIGAPWGHYVKLVHVLVSLHHFVWQFPQKMIRTGEYLSLSFSIPLPSTAVSVLNFVETI